MSARTLPSFARATRCSLNCSSRGGLHRNFSSSPIAQRGSVPSFSPTSNPELDGFLDNYRSKVFVLGNIPTALRDVVTSPKNKKQLDQEPITIGLSNERFTLRFVDKKTELPPAQGSAIKLLTLLKTGDDWKVVPEFLTGLHSSGYTPQPWVFEKLVRNAGRADRIGVLVECARRVKSTGMSLSDINTVTELMFWIQYTAYRQNWESAALSKAIKRAEQVAELLEWEEHGGGNRVLKEREDPRISPLVTGVLLQLSAIQAVKHLDGKDARGLVEKYAERLTGTVVGTDLTRTLPDVSEVGAENRLLQRLAPVMQGLRLAQTVLPSSSPAAQSLAAAEANLKARTEAARPAPGRFGTLCWDAYTGSQWETFSMPAK